VHLQNEFGPLLRALAFFAMLAEYRMQKSGSNGKREC
jgi:hypothetical protein